MSASRSNTRASALEKEEQAPEEEAVVEAPPDVPDPSAETLREITEEIAEIRKEFDVLGLQAEAAAVPQRRGLAETAGRTVLDIAGLLSGLPMISPTLRGKATKVAGRRTRAERGAILANELAALSDQATLIDLKDKHEEFRSQQELLSRPISGASERLIESTIGAEAPYDIAGLRAEQDVLTAGIPGLLATQRETLAASLEAELAGIDDFEDFMDRNTEVVNSYLSDKQERIKMLADPSNQTRFDPLVVDEMIDEINGSMRLFYGTLGSKHLRPDKYFASDEVGNLVPNAEDERKFRQAMDDFIANTPWARMSLAVGMEPTADRDAQGLMPLVTTEDAQTLMRDYVDRTMSAVNSGTYSLYRIEEERVEAETERQQRLAEAQASLATPQAKAYIKTLAESEIVDWMNDFIPRSVITGEAKGDIEGEPITRESVDHALFVAKDRAARVILQTFGGQEVDGIVIESVDEAEKLLNKVMSERGLTSLLDERIAKYFRSARSFSAKAAVRREKVRKYWERR
jgi:hypothetical protein